ncbi:MAG TPA: SCO family protein [Bryobacteraceae bacterium]|nr:SCO family protein [Bryobacteraceae bacterium]
MAIRFVFKQSMRMVLLAAMFCQGYAQPLKGQMSVGAADHRNVVYRGGMVSPPLPKPKFTLTDTSGVHFDFATKTEGYLTLLFFGFTNCPDMCPMQMHMIAQALKKIAPAAGNQIKVVFVTTDPARDSPKVLRAYLDHFDKNFIGLTGDAAAIDAAQIAANLSPAKKSPTRADGTYDVGHAAFVIAYTKDNLAHVLYPVGVKEEDLAHDLPYLANETWMRPAP